MIIQDFEHFDGQHCETTATGTLLKQIGINLSEPMLFGLGEGLGYIYWTMKTMNFPFIGGRVKPDRITENICRNLNLKLEVQETSSIKKAWHNVRNYIDQGRAVGLKLDCFHLDYFAQKIHFAGHYVAMFGYDHDFAYLIDTRQQGGRVKTSLKSLELARSQKGPMSSKNRTYVIRRNEQEYDLQQAIRTAINRNANDFLTPPIKNFGYKGILKTSTELKRWFAESTDVKGDFQTTAMLMERAGTGGALFRNLYRDFLKESYDLLKLDDLLLAYQAFCESARQWTSISNLFYLAGDTQDINYVNQASEILIMLAEQEKKAMEILKVATV